MGLALVRYFLGRFVGWVWLLYGFGRVCPADRVCVVGFGVLGVWVVWGFGGFGGLLAVGCVVFWWVVGCLGLWVCAVWCFLLDVLVSVLLGVRLELVMPVDCLGVLACCGVGIIRFCGLLGFIWLVWVVWVVLVLVVLVLVRFLGNLRVLGFGVGLRGWFVVVFLFVAV